MHQYLIDPFTVAGTVWAYPNSQYLERHYFLNYRVEDNHLNDMMLIQ